MTKDTKETLKALMGRIQQTCDDSQGHIDGDVAYEFRQLLLTDEYKAAK